MELVSWKFFALISVSLLAYHLFATPLLKRVVVVLTSIFFLIILCNFHFLTFSPTLSFVCLGYFFILLAGNLSKKTFLALAIGSIILIFAFLKRYSLFSFMPFLPQTYSTIGISYILFRIIHLMVDRFGEKTLGRVTFFEYLNYLLFFPCLISGPIQRFEDYQKTEERAFTTALSNNDIFLSFSRILKGFLKITLICPLLHAFYNTDSFAAWMQDYNFLSLSLLGILNYSIVLSCYTVYLFINFSGYMDIVIGIGALYGFIVPENFVSPFGAKNFLDFWGRWHITLSVWFKIYLFNPLLKFFVSSIPSLKISPYLGVPAFFVTFLVMGIWHGTTREFLFYGLFLGFGVSLNKLYQTIVRTMIGKKGYKKLVASVFYSSLCRGMVFAYFSLALTCVWVDPKNFSKIFTVKSFPCLLTVFVCLAFFQGFFYNLVQMFRTFYGTKISIFMNRTKEITALRILYLVFLILLFTMAAIQNTSTNFIYKTF